MYQHRFLIDKMLYFNFDNSQFADCINNALYVSNLEPYTIDADVSIFSKNQFARQSSETTTYRTFKIIFMRFAVSVFVLPSDVTCPETLFTYFFCIFQLFEFFNRHLADCFRDFANIH